MLLPAVRAMVIPETHTYTKTLHSDSENFSCIFYLYCIGMSHILDDIYCSVLNDFLSAIKEKVMEMWNNLSNDERQYWSKEYEKEKVEYDMRYVCSFTFVTNPSPIKIARNIIISRDDDAIMLLNNGCRETLSWIIPCFLAHQCDNCAFSFKLLNAFHSAIFCFTFRDRSP